MKVSSKRYYLFAVAFAVIIMLLVYAVSMMFATETEEADEKTDGLTIAVTRTLDCLPLYVADEIGLCDSLKTPVILVEYDALNDCDTAFVGGSADAIVSDCVHASRFMSQKSQHYVRLYNPNRSLSLVLSSRSRLKEISQLKDKMIAVDRKGAENLIGEMLMDSVKLNNDKSFLVNILNVDLRLRMLLNNEMEAIISPEPQTSIAAAMGNKVVHTSTQYKEECLGTFMCQSYKVSVAIESMYNRACDSINKNGIHHYDSILIKRLKVPENCLRNVPKRKFLHLQK